MTSSKTLVLTRIKKQICRKNHCFLKGYIKIINYYYLVKPCAIILPMKKKILIIDDNDLVRETLKEMLNFLGYEVVLAEEGKEAIEKFLLAEKQEQPFDIVFVDLVLPGMHGVEVMKELRKIKPDVTAVISSGYSNESALNNYEKLGFKGVLRKPYTLQELKELLRQLNS